MGSALPASKGFSGGFRKQCVLRVLAHTDLPQVYSPPAHLPKDENEGNGRVMPVFRRLVRRRVYL